MKCAVFSCLGLGDGLLALILSNNLQRNGHEVTTFHPMLSSLQGWFPLLPIQFFPEDLSVLNSFDQIFIFYEKSPWMQAVLAECQKSYPKKTKILNPIATKNRDYLYWEEGRFEGDRSFVDNLVAYCKRQGWKDVVKGNGIQAPGFLLRARLPKRVILHATSSRPGKNWPEEKYVQLAEALEGRGFEPLFVLSEKEEWGGGRAVRFKSLEELAALVYESGYMIGNDSGVGHLASCLGLPTLTIARNVGTAQFWRPSWSHGELITPPLWIPNVKGLRLRDRHWKRWISVRRVVKAFLRIAQDRAR